MLEGRRFRSSKVAGHGRRQIPHKNPFGSVTGSQHLHCLIRASVRMFKPRFNRGTTFLRDRRVRTLSCAMERVPRSRVARWACWRYYIEPRSLCFIHRLYSSHPTSFVGLFHPWSVTRALCSGFNLSMRVGELHADAVRIIVFRLCILAESRHLIVSDILIVRLPVVSMC